MRRSRPPQRTCIACRRKGDQASFLRVRSDGAKLGWAPHAALGRSAYLCPHAACLEKGLRRDRIGRALRREVSPEAIERLREEAECKLR